MLGKSGRPSTKAERADVAAATVPRSRAVLVRLTPSEHAAVSAFARLRSVSASTFLRILLREWAHEKGEVMP